MNKQDATFSAWAGHAIDLWRLVRLEFRNPHSYSKFRIINRLRKATGGRVMLETGTYLGNTADRCARKFQKVYTIELDETLARRARAFLKRRPNVQVIQGDALMEMPKVLEQEDVQDVVVFLDGHFSGGVTAEGDIPEPAVQELVALKSYKNKIRAIIIDDFRSFGKEPGFPSKAELLQTIEYEFGDLFSVTVHFDQVIVARRECRAVPE